MVFSSLFFVFFFLAVCMGVQYFLPDITRKNMVLLGFSLVFYAWGGPKYLILLLAMVAITWFGGCRMEDAVNQKQKKGFLIATVGLDLLILAIFKYTGFFLSNVQLLTGFPKVVPEIALPIGISFYTFQLISYAADVYRGEVRAQRKYWLLLLYAGLFHQCIAGPIVRYRDVNHDILHRKVSCASPWVWPRRPFWPTAAPR
jgi:alginate O-acetyltransferase complex protein AlgI